MNNAAAPPVPAVDTCVPVGPWGLPADLVVPAGARGLVVFAHGSGSSRLSPRNRYVARVLRDHGLGTLLMDLLGPGEDSDRQRVFDIPQLAARVMGVLDDLPTLRELPAPLAKRPVGLFGASTGAAAALQAAAVRPGRVSAVVSRGGRVDLAPDARAVRVPTLLIVGGSDGEVLQLNRQTLQALACEKELVVVPGATHLFEEPGTLEDVARLAAQWFVRHAPA